MVGGSRFSVFGRPLLDSVKVEATVVEKTTTYPELEYIRDNHNHIKVINCTFWFHFFISHGSKCALHMLMFQG